MVSTSPTDGAGSTDAPQSGEGAGPPEVTTSGDASASPPDAGDAGDGGGDGGRQRVGKPGRYERSPSGMVGALIVTLLVILAFVAFRAFNRSDLDVKPEKVDYLSQVRLAQRDAPDHGADLVYPATLPAGWYVTNVRFLPDGTRSGIELSMLTPDQQYVGFVQSPESLGDLLTTYVDPHPQPGTAVTVDGSVVPQWSTWTDGGGDTALASKRGHDALLVFGTVSQSQLEQLAASLTTAPVAR